MDISLKDLKIGERGRVQIDESIIATPKYIELGLTPGTLVEIKTKAPLGGPISVKLIENNVLLALRKQDAQFVKIEKV